jgi:hypothetical protein
LSTAVSRARVFRRGELGPKFISSAPAADFADASARMIGASKFLAARRVQMIGWALVGVFLWLIAAFYDPRTGFTRLLAIGDQLESSIVPKLQQVPHYVYDGTIGYDGAYYVQLALHPTLREPQLRNAIDNLPYRAKRMAMYWTAWFLGLGRDAWIVNAFALLNVAAWLILAWQLLRWFPLNTWDNLVRWAGILFSHGACMSVRNSLADLPSLVLVTAAVACIERDRRGRGIAALAAAALTKETSMLAIGALFESERRADRPTIRGWARWSRFFVGATAVAAPLVLWSMYVAWRVGPTGDLGLNNFAWPGQGLAEKWGTAIGEFLVYGAHPPYVASLLTVTALTVQGLFLFLRRSPQQAWWRVGVAFAALMLFVSQPVWEGYPGAASRVLLPMALAFNVLVPRGVRWWPLLILGNITVFVSPQELKAPPEFFHVHGSRAIASELKVERLDGWYAAETIREFEWRWSKGESGLKLTNTSTKPMALAIRGYVTSAGDERRLRIFQGEAMLWSEMISARTDVIRFGLVLPPGAKLMSFKSDKPPLMVDTDPRPLSFKIMNLEIVVSPTDRQR